MLFLFEYICGTLDMIYFDETACSFANCANSYATRMGWSIVKDFGDDVTHVIVLPSRAI